MQQLLPHLRRLARLPGETADAELLNAFLSQRDEAAFTALVRRHGPMVLAVCQRVLRDPHDAEDAFQATFLVLVRKAGALRRPEQLSSWLYGVAYRTALDSRPARRSIPEQELATRVQEEPIADLVWQELRLILDEELQRLPVKYRLPLVLCYLEGKSQRVIARELGWPDGTVATRILKAKELLREQLTRRGLTLSAGVVGVALTQGMAGASLPVSLISSTVKAALLLQAGEALAGVLSIKVIALMEGTVQAMLWTKMKLTAVVLLLAMGAGGVAYQARSQEAPKQKRTGQQEDLQLRVQEMEHERQALKDRVQMLEARLRDPSRDSFRDLTTEQEQALAAVQVALAQLRKTIQGDAARQESLREVSDAARRLDEAVKKVRPAAQSNLTPQENFQNVFFRQFWASKTEPEAKLRDRFAKQTEKPRERAPESGETPANESTLRYLNKRLAQQLDGVVKAVGEDGLVLLEVSEKTELKPGQSVEIVRTAQSTTPAATITILFQKDHLAVGKVETAKQTPEPGYRLRSRNSQSGPGM